MKPKRRNFYLEFIIGIIAIYVSVLILLFIFQRSLMYHPLENNYSGDRMEVEVEKVKIITSDNINLLGWFHKKDLKKFKTILYFHGNAGTLENRIHKLNHFKDMDVSCSYWLGSLFYLSFLLEVAITYFSKIYISCFFWSNKLITVLYNRRSSFSKNYF